MGAQGQRGGVCLLGVSGRELQSYMCRLRHIMTALHEINTGNFHHLAYSDGQETYNIIVRVHEKQLLTHLRLSHASSRQMTIYNVKSRSSATVLSDGPESVQLRKVII